MASSLQSNRVSPPSAFCTCFRRCNMMCWRVFKWVPVLLILSIVIWSYYAYVIQLCFFTIESVVQKCIYLIVYHFFVVFLIWSYWRTIFAEIRTIPDKFKLPEADLEKLLSVETEDAQRQVLENFAKDLPVVTRTMSGSVRYCHRCVLVKPDRAHHCSICSKCVMKMDHHCPWVNNCVCFHNYKFFMLFLGYALLYCLFVMSTCLPYFIKFWKGEVAQATGAGRYHIVFAFFVALMFGISLGSLFGYHCYLVAHNRTTLDYLQSNRVNGRPPGRMFRTVLNTMYLEAFRAPMFRGGTDKNGFSIGCYNNFKEVFGHKPSLWFVPVFTSVGDGCEFPARREHQMATFTTQVAQDARGYDSMASTPHSFGDGIVYQLPPTDEDAESLLTSERWDRWGERARPFDEEDFDGSSYDEL